MTFLLVGVYCVVLFAISRGVSLSPVVFREKRSPQGSPLELVHFCHGARTERMAKHCFHVLKTSTSRLNIHTPSQRSTFKCSEDQTNFSKENMYEVWDTRTMRPPIPDVRYKNAYIHYQRNASILTSNHYGSSSDTIRHGRPMRIRIGGIGRALSNLIGCVDFKYHFGHPYFVSWFYIYFSAILLDLFVNLSRSKRRMYWVICKFNEIKSASWDASFFSKRNPNRRVVCFQTKLMG